MDCADADGTQCPIHSELLCFVTNKSSILSVDDLVGICADFYKTDEIEQTRLILSMMLNSQKSKKRLPKHTGSDDEKKKRTVTDIVKLCLDPTVVLPVFYAVDLARLPPVGVQHVDISALLLEVAALRAEVRAAVAIKEELASVRAAVTALGSAPVQGIHPDATQRVTRTAAEVVRDSIHNGTLRSEQTKPVNGEARKPIARSRPKPVVGSSETNSHVKGVETSRTVDIFVSRLHPSTAKSELIDCVNVIKEDLVVQSVECEQLTSSYAHLYSSFHIAITVGSTAFHKAITLFTSADAWPMGVFVRRYFKPKAVTNEAD
jgi:hypothetical protein